MVGMDTTAPDLFSWIRRQTSAQPYQPSKIICLFKELIYTSFHVTWAFPTATCHLDILYSYILECLLHPLIICSSSSWCLHPNLTHVVALVHTRIYSSNFKWTELKPKVAPLLLLFLFVKISIQTPPPTSNLLAYTDPRWIGFQIGWEIILKLILYAPALNEYSL